MMNKRQAGFDMAVKQGMRALTQDDSATAVAEDAAARGPAPAIAEAVDKALEGIVQAAQASGVELEPEVVEAAAVAIAAAMSSMMVQAGGAEDQGALLQEVVGILGVGEQQEPPQEAPEGALPAAQGVPA